MKNTHHRFNQIIPEIEAKVEELLAKMSLEQKAWQMAQHNPARLGQEETERRIRLGLGSILNFYDHELIHHYQNIAVKESPLGIPLLVGNDVIHGYRTIFPIPLAESCSWDPELVQEAARIAAEEASAHGTNWIFAPMVDVGRDARWGRVAEGSGEDVYLGIELGKARVRGFQSELSNGHKIVACPKHFAAYGAAEAGRDYNTVDISERTLRDVYLPPFKAAFDEGAGTAMSSFNEIGGVPSSGSHFLLTKILREEWGWPGMVVSDWNAVFELIAHGLAEDLHDAGRKAALAGTDMDMASDAFPLHLAELVESGAVPLEIVDEAVRRQLRLKLALGLFAKPQHDVAQASASILKPAYRQTALEITQKSMVLLQNEGDLLPLSQETKHVALIGPLADDHHEILGCWYRIGEDGDTESVLDGVTAVLPHAQITHVKGCDLEGKEGADMDTAVAAAKAADVAILVLGEGEHMSGEAHSRAYLDLPGDQQVLLEAVHATGTPVVVVLMSGRPLTLSWLFENVPAVLQAWHGGIRTGRAVANILFGNVNPSAKLVMSWPRTVGQLPIYYNHKNTGRPVEGEGTMQFNKPHWSIFIDEQNAPQFPFGHGLSYTQFSYSDLLVETPEVGLDDEVVVTAVITNSGSCAGNEIVQLYVRDIAAEVTRPVRELKGFQKISLAAGESQTVRFTIPMHSLGFHGLDMQYKVEPGKFHVWVAPDAASGLQGEFVVS